MNADGLGRNIDEVLRTLVALQYTEEHGVVCPANWQKGDKTLEASAQGVKDYFN